MTTLCAADVIVRTNNSLETELDDETIVMNIASGTIYGLADSAKDIWRQLSEPASFGRLVDDMVARFEVPAALCGKEVSAFLLSLQREGMVEIRKS
jgi:hypothetical protein